MMSTDLERKVGALRGIPGGGEDEDAVKRRIFYINLKPINLRRRIFVPRPTIHINNSNIVILLRLFVQ